MSQHWWNADEIMIEFGHSGLLSSHHSGIITMKQYLWPIHLYHEMRAQLALNGHCLFFDENNTHTHTRARCYGTTNVR